MNRLPESVPAFALLVEAWAVAATLASTLLMKFLIS